ncbi:MAG: GNAT family N-acetyltransferase [Microcoleus sp. PH2017_10_PVI_O_A]|uniref:GNAT family N-acetyltransferase n=1 Tax=unclassified Microcoleus TaxID=2642155 RepID=UPI001DC81AE0|nr:MULTISPECIES: GNAT family N-acetyltransferase [unclassified Microcoleus]TAE83014.1 MAG: N-acetyltransferase [Oscillatoriales cyanobacterium]MCC3406582.1 GNAT family N-acetyltransferase [Microcoleus sp. PH2017_10_PVI_O_A]MCC3460596.1 GNAT family N-acetyltransferase [Microcoleus sp. PH2017_11_PCY_U_A]MCC3479086.1 GNAT family N-acetyltransferase [Microcoleus sp. PH2017_12_PCY_D_A]MCC3528907.1 GNAT family N-acetyltransferase [Microcoleus sp. PH2017_21_RUC_O_A]
MTDKMDKYRIVETLTDSQVSDLMDLYKNEFWCNKRTREDVVRMLAATDVIIGLVDEGDGVPPRKLRLIGFSRVMTDFVYRGTIFDVIVHPTYRKMGLGKVLMDAVLNHPQLQAVENLSLNCLPKMIPFYKRWGFTDDIGEMKFMRKMR